MKQIVLQQTLILMRWVSLWLVIGSLLSLFTWRVVAQEPTPIPTPTPADTPTPTATLATPISPTSEPSPTPTSTSSSTTTRLIAFRVDDAEIAQGECALFTWVVKGDVGIVEFDIKEDGKAAFLVSEEGERKECPEKETKYQLFVTWLDGSKSEGDVIKVKIASNSSSSGSGSGSATPPPGTFMAVTPISVQDVPGSVLVTPVGALSSVTFLPETGVLSSSRSKTIQAEGNLVAPQAQWPLLLGLASKFAVTLGSIIVGLVLLARYFSK